MTKQFRVGLTRDLSSAELGDVGLDLLDGASGIEWEFLTERFPVLEANRIQGYDAVAVLGGRVTAESVDGADRLAILARYGVGYDTIDIDACTRNGIAVTIAPDGVRRPMATAILTLVLALSGRLLEKDRLTRAGGWARKIDYMGTGLTGKTLGSIGLGNIGREFFALAAPLQMRHIAHDPYAVPGATPGVELVELASLFRTADIIVVTCALTPETHHLVNAERIALMKPTAYLVNTARGPVVDQAALTAALHERRIAGAGLDVFEQEPLDTGDPLLDLDNVIVTPHALGWTDEWIHCTGRSALGGILEVATGREPPFVVNREVLQSPLFQEKLAWRRR